LTFLVELTEQAEEEAEQAYLWIAERDPDGAARWWQGLVEAVLSLEQMPLRCALAPEDPYFEEEIRTLLYRRRIGQFRILFTVRGQQVQVPHIRSASRDVLS
jgi:plasmid stabilization system protein ParE